MDVTPSIAVAITAEAIAKKKKQMPKILKTFYEFKFGYVNLYMFYVYTTTTLIYIGIYIKYNISFIRSKV